MSKHTGGAGIVRTPEEILATGAAWVTESEIHGLVAALSEANQKLEVAQQSLSLIYSHNHAHTQDTVIREAAMRGLDALARGGGSEFVDNSGALH